MQLKTRPAKHWSSYLPQIAYAIAFAIVVERAYPTPWLQGPFGVVTYIFILFYIAKGLIEYRQTKSARFYAKTQAYWEFVKGKGITMPPYVRYRLTQVWRAVVIGLAIGYIIDMSTPACEGALNCAVSVPNLIASNMKDLIQFIIRLALGFAGFLGVQEMAARQGLMDVTLPHSIKTRFSDVYGQDSAVSSVKEALEILNHPEETEALGGYMPTGILMYGPPGVGKSWLAEAAAGEAHKPFVSIDGSSFTSMWAGVPQRRVKLIFKKLRGLAVKHGGVIVFFDEIDVLGSRGGGVLNALIYKFMNRNADAEDVVAMSFGGGSGALQQLLTEMSGMKKSRGLYNKLRVWFGFEPLPPVEPPILWMAATNMESALDAALTRPGRFDRKLRMGYPNLSGRVETINGYLGKIHAHNLTSEQVLTLARENRHATGASIKAMVNEGLLAAIRAGRDYVEFADIRDHLLLVKMGESQGAMELPEDRWRTAVHEAAHAVMSHHERPEAPIQFASVLKRGDTGGFVSAVDDVDRYTLKSRIHADIKVCLASTWAEKHYFADNVSSGPSGDLQKATAFAKGMFTKLGMGTTLMVFKDEEIPQQLLVEIENYINDTYVIVEKFMEAHRDEVELVAQLLDQYGTVDGTEVHALLERMQ